MSGIVSKFTFKLQRSLGSKRLMQIKDGPLQNKWWNVQIPDSRYLLGTYEPELARLVKEQVEKGKRFVDIGANAGYFSLLAATYSAIDTVHLAVEPFPANIAFLKQHLTSNGIKNIVIADLAISDKEGEISFSNTENLAANTYKSESSMFNENVIKVKTVTLDALAQTYDLDGNTFLKIDVEGAELDVLKGGMNYLKTHHPDFVLATHDCHVAGVKDACLSLLKELNYSCETLEDDKMEGQEDFFCYY